MSQEVFAENLGPIEQLSFSLSAPGVTVLVGPNGAGKSILLSAVQSAAQGKGKLPLKDHTRKGMFRACGATITIGHSTRHTGDFQVTHLEGKFDLATLVDPQLKSSVAADRARIKALILLTGVEANTRLFSEHAAFDDFDTVVGSEASRAGDLVEMSQRIKECYDQAALKLERQASQETASASAKEPPANLDMTIECDADTLLRAYNAARDARVTLESQVAAAQSQSAKIAAAQAVLDAAGMGDVETQLQGLSDSADRAESERLAAITQRDAALAQITELQHLVRTHNSTIANCNAQINVIAESKAALESQARQVEAARTAVNATVPVCPTEAEIAAAKSREEECRTAIDAGGTVRTAKQLLAVAQRHRATAKDLQEKAGRYRDAGKAVDEVLSSAIKCKHLRVESDGDAARLVTTTDRGSSVPYHELSDGQRWRIAIDIGAEQVGDGGLMVITQVGWEGLDAANRVAIHEYAVEKNVYILTAKASDDPNAERTIIPTTMQSPQNTPSTKPSPPARKASAAPTIDLYGDEDIPF